MAWRFKASKYKNAAPIVPKPEMCVRDICVGSYQTYGNNIAASAAFMAFNWEHAGSSLAVLPLDDCGRKSKTMPLLHGHTDTVTDLGFSPFHDGLLATASQDTLVKLWYIPERGLEAPLTQPECTFTHKQRRVETVGFHPTADCLLHSTAAGSIQLWDLNVQKEVLTSNEHPDVIQSLSWKLDGTQLATSCKDKAVRIVDPRAPRPIQLTAASHQSIKDSRVVWMGGDQQRILTTGFDSQRLRQIIVRDLRNFDVPEKTLELDCSTGILMPLYDPDTNMLFLAGKGDTTIAYMEVTEKEPHLIEGLRHNGEQTKGACLVPKRALRVMEGEVNRIMQLTSNSVIPIMYQVPRKTYRDFHADLYPETRGYRTELGAAQWLTGVDVPLATMSLDPAKRELGEQPIIIHRGNLTEIIKNNANRPPAKVVPVVAPTAKITRSLAPAKTAVPKKEEEVDGGSDELAQQLSKMDIIKKFDNKYREEEKPQQRDDNGGGDGGDIGGGGGSGSQQSSFEEDAPPMSAATPTAQGHSNGGTPPKPLPRTSRNNSMSDQGVQSGGSDDSMSERSRPVARPRTAATYKPRLGPKPFTSASGDVSFDKVFSVPSVPGNGSGEIVDETPEKAAIDGGDEEDEDEEPVLREKPTVETPEDYTNGDSSDLTESNSLEEDLQRAISTAERRKLSDDNNKKIFESNRSESENSLNGDEKAATGGESELRRMSINRSSIADRRKLYEGRSMSVQPDKPVSPLPLTRKDSLKLRSHSPKSTSPSADVFKVPASTGAGGDVVDKRSTGSVSPAAVPKKSPAVAAVTETTAVASSKRTSTVFGKVSKFRHLKGTPAHKSTHIENIRNISRQIPGECNGFQANHRRVAVPIAGPGGKIAVYELGRPGRLPDGVIPSLVNGANIMDFQWDPFDADVLAVAGDDGIVRLWRIPADGLQEPTNEPHAELTAHSDKIYFVRFHPLASGVLLTASYDMSMKLWDVASGTEKMCLTGHTDQIFDFAWSPCGQYGATVCKDGKVRVYNARKAEQPVREGAGPVGTRGARIAWVLDGQYIVCTGFDKVSERQISIYKANDLRAPLNTVGLDVSPSILQPFYDEDSSTLFVTGKGDSTIYAFEITDEAPHICPLSHHRCGTLHQGLSFLTKNHCDVSAVEFAKALRLTNNTVEPLSFTVPRIKSELFQDDLFPPTAVTWTPTMTSDEWYTHKDKKVRKVSLQPTGMDSLSSVQPTIIAPTPTKADNNSFSRLNSINADSAKSKQDEIHKMLATRLEMNTKLEQDEMEGVGAEEWNE